MVESWRGEVGGKERTLALSSLHKGRSFIYNLKDQELSDTVTTYSAVVWKTVIKDKGEREAYLGYDTHEDSSRLSDATFLLKSRRVDGTLPDYNNYCSQYVVSRVCVYMGKERSEGKYST